MRLRLLLVVMNFTPKRKNIYLIANILLEETIKK